MIRTTLFAALALLAFGASHAADTKGAPSAPEKNVSINAGMKSLPVKVFLTAEGKVERIEWVAPEIASENIRQYLTPLITQTEFEPATVNGKPMTSELLMNAILQVRPKNDGKGELQFITLEKTVAAVLQTGDLHYPSSALTQGVSAYVVLSAEIGSDGKAIARTIALDGTPKKSEAQRIGEFYREARRAMLKSQFALTEKVGDQFVGGVIRVPFVFCVDSCDAIHAKVAKIRAQQVMMPSKESGIGLAQLKQGSIPADG
jgi:hypothetical protein